MELKLKSASKPTSEILEGQVPSTLSSIRLVGDLECLPYPRRLPRPTPPYSASAFAIFTSESGTANLVHDVYLQAASLNPSEMICAQCHQIYFKDYPVGWEGHTHTHDYKAVHGPAREVKFLPHYSSYIEFEQSARKGCHICLLFCNQISDNDRHELRQIGLNGYISCREPSSQIDPRHLFG
jgi:hypothetical protein